MAFQENKPRHPPAQCLAAWHPDQTGSAPDGIRPTESLVDRRGSDPQDLKDTTADLRDKLFWFVSYAEQDALSAAGLNEFLNDGNLVPLEQRLAALATLNQDQPPPPAPA